MIDTWKRVVERAYPGHQAMANWNSAQRRAELAGDRFELSRGGRRQLLDLGAGGGLFAYRAEQHGHDVLAIDHHPNWPEIAALLDLGNAQQFSLDALSVERVLAQQPFHHVWWAAWNSNAIPCGCEEWVTMLERIIGRDHPAINHLSVDSWPTGILLNRDDMVDNMSTIESIARACELSYSIEDNVIWIA